MLVGVVGLLSTNLNLTHGMDLKSNSSQSTKSTLKTSGLNNPYQNIMQSTNAPSKKQQGKKSDQDQINKIKIQFTDSQNAQLQEIIQDLNNHVNTLIHTSLENNYDEAKDKINKPTGYLNQMSAFLITNENAYQDLTRKIKLFFEFALNADLAETAKKEGPLHERTNNFLNVLIQSMFGIEVFNSLDAKHSLSALQTRLFELGAISIASNIQSKAHNFFNNSNQIKYTKENLEHHIIKQLIDQLPQDFEFNKTTSAEEQQSKLSISDQIQSYMNKEALTLRKKFQSNNIDYKIQKLFKQIITMIGAGPASIAFSNLKQGQPCYNAFKDLKNQINADQAKAYKSDPSIKEIDCNKETFDLFKNTLNEIYKLVDEKNLYKKKFSPFLLLNNVITEANNSFTALCKKEYINTIIVTDRDTLSSIIKKIQIHNAVNPNAANHFSLMVNEQDLIKLHPSILKLITINQLTHINHEQKKQMILTEIAQDKITQKEALYQFKPHLGMFNIKDQMIIYITDIFLSANNLKDLKAILNTSHEQMRNELPVNNSDMAQKIKTLENANYIQIGLNISKKQTFSLAEAGEVVNLFAGLLKRSMHLSGLSKTSYANLQHACLQIAHISQKYHNEDILSTDEDQIAKQLNLQNKKLEFDGEGILKRISVKPNGEEDCVFKLVLDSSNNSTFNDNQKQ